MRRCKSLIAFLLVIIMVATIVSGCQPKSKDVNKASSTADSGSKDNADNEGPKEVKQFTAFIAMPGTELSDDNRMMEEIAKVTGAKAKITWLTGQTASESIGALIAGGEYPDFIDGSDGTAQLIEAGALLPIDEYWDDYPNIKNYLSEEDWNRLRKEDGHIYVMPQFGITYGKDTRTIHNDEAFWIQLRVLEWAGYPEINTVEEYFDVIERYLEANPTMEDGTTNIGFEILCDDWRYFCLENPPMFLDGYPNDGCCIVDAENLKAIDYNTTPTAKKYFSIINEKFKKGIVDPETFTASYDQYIAKLSTGRVLGMVDQRWNYQDAEFSLMKQGLNEHCYVPIGVTIDKGIEERYSNSPVLNVAAGLGITTSCKDVEGAFKFVNDLLSPEVQTLRYWGIEGVDHYVDEDGLFYRDETQRANQKDPDWKVSNWCNYDYFPHYDGMNMDNINAYCPDNQPGEYFATLTEPMQKCLSAYGVQTIMQLLNPPLKNEPWFPMWTFTGTWTSDTDHGIAKVNMDEVKHEYLPKVCMADDFETAWDEYMNVYNSRVDVDAYLNALTTEIQRRVDEIK